MISVDDSDKSFFVLVTPGKGKKCNFQCDDSCSFFDSKNILISLHVHWQRELSSLRKSSTWFIGAHSRAYIKMKGFDLWECPRKKERKRETNKKNTSNFLRRCHKVTRQRMYSVTTSIFVARVTCKIFMRISINTKHVLRLKMWPNLWWKITILCPI